jgi:phage FluMu protein Com
VPRVVGDSKELMMYAEQMLKCTNCNKLMGESEFYNYTHERRCKNCVSEIRKTAYRKDVEKHKERKRNFTRNNPESIKSTKLKQAYGITLKEY